MPFPLHLISSQLLAIPIPDRIITVEKGGERGWKGLRTPTTLPPFFFESALHCPVHFLKLTDFEGRFLGIVWRFGLC